MHDMIARWVIATGTLAAGLCALAWEDPRRGDHVGQGAPEYMTGDECLFCHRQRVGPSWTDNRHQTTIRSANRRSPALQALLHSESAGPFADDVEFVLGRDRMIRYLRSASAYGTLDMLSAACRLHESGATELTAEDDPHWDGETFAVKCAGCHATAVDPQSGAFSAVSLDCYVCHGDVPQQHANDTSLVHLSQKREDPPHVVISICGQCHIRTGESRSTRRPFPNNFVPGDNLFRDFAVDFSDEHIASLNPIDRHVLVNVRDVVRGRTTMTCLSCHEVHDESTITHQGLEHTSFCNNCHFPDRPKERTRPLNVHSETCGY